MTSKKTDQERRLHKLAVESTEKTQELSDESLNHIVAQAAASGRRMQEYLLARVRPKSNVRYR